MADVVVKVAEASELLKIKQNTNILASRALAPKHNVEAAATDKLHFLASRALSEGLTEPRHFYHQLFSYDEKEISWTEAPSTKVRASWNKYNLFNLSRLKNPRSLSGTYYQQKWGAKSVTRAYHGEQIREKQWQRMFRSRLHAVIPMDHRYLARNDGAELAAGRGSGKDVPFIAEDVLFGKNRIPYMNMTYAPIERRLDTAIFRALFASSARQARQFVTHGHVKVNGKLMPYPGYLLNPGDMFQVEPDRVLFATGAPKKRDQILLGRRIRKATRRENIRIDRHDKAEHTRTGSKIAKNSKSSTKPDLILAPGTEAGDVVKMRTQRKLNLKYLLTNATAILESKTNEPSAKVKQELRALSKTVRSTMNQVSKKPIHVLDDVISTLASRLSLATSPDPVAAESREPAETSEEDRKALRDALRRARENPIDESKPYATPWRPRNYMSAFAFIPRYLEVNQNVCSAVYLRHPVARPGLAEVPSPFSGELQQLAFNWYLRRR